MHSTDSVHSSDDSGPGDDPRQSGSVPNSLSQLQDDYATGSDSVVSCTPEKKFEEQDGCPTALICTRPLSLPSAEIIKIMQKQSTSGI
jgi:hypothetical protein